jgi:hypothetical protein
LAIHEDLAQKLSAEGLGLIWAWTGIHLKFGPTRKSPSILSNKPLFVCLPISDVLVSCGSPTPVQFGADPSRTRKSPFLSSSSALQVASEASARHGRHRFDFDCPLNGRGSLIRVERLPMNAMCSCTVRRCKYICPDD